MLSTFSKLAGFFLSAVVAALIGIYVLPNLAVLSSILGKENAKLASPATQSVKFASNLWFPENVSAVTTSNGPEITAQSAYFVDASSGKVLYEKDPHKHLEIASLTKIMTVILTLESRDFGDKVEISQTAADMEPDKMRLIAGEKLSVEELLDGIFLVSANDAAQALAESYSGGKDEFVRQMNIRAQELGMKDTLFINPTGLEEDDKDQYSSAYDVTLMSRYAINQFPHILDISSNPHIYLPLSSTHQDYDLYSGINLLTTYPGVVGLKTGYTPTAGLTLVTVAHKGGHTVLGVILNSDDRRGEAKELLDYSFQQLGIES